MDCSSRSARGGASDKVKRVSHASTAHRGRGARHGGHRGVGKGVALGLGEAGATVYVTGRTVAEGEAAIPLPGTIGGTADEVTRLGGRGIAVRCDHRDDDQTRAVIERIRAEQHGRLDVLVNNVWGGYERRSAEVDPRSTPAAAPHPGTADQSPPREVGR